VLIVGVLACLGLIVLLRLSGKRTLAKMNAFDFVVTVALGSTLATVLLSKDVALAEGLVAFATLIALQFIIAWLSVRSQTISGFVKSEPSLLLYRGRFLHETLRRERVTEEEVRSAIRQGGHGALERWSNRLVRWYAGGMRAYSMDLRERVARAVANGMSKAEAARRYELGLSTVKRYVRLGAGGSLRPRISPGRPRALDAAGVVALRAQVAAYPDATIAEHQRLWQAAQGTAPSRATLGRALRRVGWTRKKSR